MTFKIAYGLPLDEMLRWGLFVSEPRSIREADQPFPEPGDMADLQAMPPLQAASRGAVALRQTVLHAMNSCRHAFACMQLLIVQLAQTSAAGVITSWHLNSSSRSLHVHAICMPNRCAYAGLFVLNPDGQLVIIDYSNSPFARPDLRILVEGGFPNVLA